MQSANAKLLLKNRLYSNDTTMINEHNTFNIGNSPKGLKEVDSKDDGTVENVRLTKRRLIIHR